MIYKIFLTLIQKIDIIKKIDLGGFMNKIIFLQKLSQEKRVYSK